MSLLLFINLFVSWNIIKRQLSSCFELVVFLVFTILYYFSSTDHKTKIKEILMVSGGQKNKRPYLFALIDQDIIIYECFSYIKQTLNSHLAVRFKRVCYKTYFLNYFNYNVKTNCTSNYNTWDRLVSHNLIHWIL